MIPWLSPTHLDFPPVDDALQEPNGLLAAGGDLSAQRLVNAYRHGIFPWFSEDEPILWWSPNPRCVLKPSDIYISKSMKKHIKKYAWNVTFDHAFNSVIEHCSALREESGTWITDEIITAYQSLHQQGVAHSVEVWSEHGELIGGLYGLAMGKLFFGESMFSLRPNASKVAFIKLARQLNTWGYPLIDCQVHNPHLESLGAIGISRDEFLLYINSYIDSEPEHQWIFDHSC